MHSWMYAIYSMALLCCCITSSLMIFTVYKKIGSRKEKMEWLFPFHMGSTNCYCNLIQHNCKIFEKYHCVIVKKRINIYFRIVLTNLYANKGLYFFNYMPNFPFSLLWFSFAIKLISISLVWESCFIYFPSYIYSYFQCHWLYQYPSHSLKQVYVGG